jgi:hypothetical protein
MKISWWLSPHVTLPICHARLPTCNSCSNSCLPTLLQPQDHVCAKHNCTYTTAQKRVRLLEHPLFSEFPGLVLYWKYSRALNLCTCESLSAELEFSRSITANIKIKTIKIGHQGCATGVGNCFDYRKMSWLTKSSRVKTFIDISL